MTPFESWYATNIAATLPKDFPPQLAEQAKASMKACWNAAIDAVMLRPVQIMDDGEFARHVEAVRAKT
jgi:hypothetical protein